MKGTFHSWYRPRLDLIINWSFLMDRKEFKEGDPHMIVSSQIGSAAATEILKFSLGSRGIPFFQREVTVTHIEEVEHAVILQIVHPKCKDPKLLQPMVVKLSELMKESNGSTKFAFMGAKTNCPDILIFTRRRLPDPYRYEIDLKCEDVKDIEWTSKSDPYIKILSLKPIYPQVPSKLESLPSSDWQDVYFSEFKQDNLNPDFAEFILYSGLLCYNDHRWPLKIEIWDFEEGRPESHRFIGSKVFSIRDLIDGQKSFEVKESNGKSKAGTVIIQKFNYIRQYSIHDYLAKGLEINCFALIDFSASNGDPTSFDSLHSMSARGQYQAAMETIMPAIFNIDSDRIVPCYGFGATFPNIQINEPKHFFHLIGREQSARIPNSLETMISFYKSAFSYVKGCEPTLLSPALKAMIEFVEISMAGTKYNPLSYYFFVVFTDGKIEDMEETCDLMVRSSKLPMGFLFLGVGESDFKKLEYFDNDCGKKLIDKSDNFPIRDHAQLVKFTRAQGHPAEVVNKALFELPHQIVGYFLQHKIYPE